MQDVHTVFDLQGNDEDYSWELMGIQGQLESLEERKLFRDEVRELLTIRGGRWTSQQVAEHFKVSNERARTTLIKLYEKRCGIDRCRRGGNGGRPTWLYFATASRALVSLVGKPPSDPSQDGKSASWKTCWKSIGKVQQ